MEGRSPTKKHAIKNKLKVVNKYFPVTCKAQYRETTTVYNTDEPTLRSRVFLKKMTVA